RGFLAEFVTGREGLERFFVAPADERAALLPAWQRSPYWGAAFRTAFCDPFLNAMFGPAATQHATPGSYGTYFEHAFSRGLAAPGARENPFLQHVLLGRYLEAPAYARGGPLPSRPALVEGSLLEVSELGRFDLVSLSNVFDWSDDTLCARWGRVLARQLRPGSAILLRQLNNDRSLRPFFEPHFRFDDPIARDFARRDRSLFYNRFEIGFREAS
ncbi:MAG TPA: hypothetical protein VFS00_02095, partial [Polyangiaceae bacterium]|nr:hypothetical protein [Polyangiaceae bacterium]